MTTGHEAVHCLRHILYPDESDSKYEETTANRISDWIGKQTGYSPSWNLGSADFWLNRFTQFESNLIPINLKRGNSFLGRISEIIWLGAYDHLPTFPSEKVDLWLRGLLRDITTSSADKLKYGLH